MKKIFFGVILFGFSITAMAAATFTLKSEDIAANTTIPVKYSFNKFGCQGENISPAFSWSGAPEGTKSFAIAVHDPDAVTGGAGFWHWMVVDIPATTNSLPRGSGAADGKSLPAGAKHITTDFGSLGWGGPCPPVGDKPHKYNVTIYALKTDKLGVADNASASLAGFLINQNVIGKASFTSKFAR